MRHRLVLIVWATAALAAAGCDTSWNARERQGARAALARIRSAAASKQAAAQPPGAPAAPAARPVKQGEVRLTLFDALRIAIQNNHDIQIAGYDPLIAETDVVTARAAYDPNLVLSNTFGRAKRPIASQLDTGGIRDTHLTEDTWQFRGGMAQRIGSGATVSLTQEMNYLDTNSQLIQPNPQYTSRLVGEVSQPLLKGFGDPLGRAAIRIANLAAGVSLHDFRQKVMEVTAKVTAAYWQVAFDLDMARVFRESLEMAREVERREKARAGQGISNDLNIARAVSSVATREVEVLRAENRARNSADELKRLLNAPDMPVDSDVALVPIEQPRFFLVDVDRTASMTRALSRRPELDRARATLAINRIRVDVSDRQRLPKLDALLRYSLNGLGNDLGASMDSQRLPDPATWSAGLEFEFPLGNRAAEAERQRRRVEYEQALLGADRLTDQVLQEVSMAARAVLQGRDEVESTLRARDAARKVIHGETVLMDLQPMDRQSNEQLLRSQDILAAAQRDHLVALLNFNLALTELSRAQGTLVEDTNIEIVWSEADRPGRLAPLGARLPEKND
ncbi:MAG TPA: TolC family protein [Phycisphaerae bacterium]|nr:TolC family protein [Phycisphaerae bacterium]